MHIATTPKFTLFIWLLITIVIAVIPWPFPQISLLAVLAMVLVVLISFLHYQLHITDKGITYRVMALNSTVKKRHIATADITRIEFTRRQDDTIFQAEVFTTTQNLSLLRFDSPDLYTELREFCQKHHIPHN